MSGVLRAARGGALVLVLALSVLVGMTLISQGPTREPGTDASTTASAVPTAAASTTASVVPSAAAIWIVALEYTPEATGPAGPTVTTAGVRALLTIDLQGNTTRNDLGGTTFADLVGWEPTSGQVAFWRTRTNQRAAPFELVVLDVAKGGIRTLTTVSNGHPTTPVWSIDASEIAFAVASDQTFAVAADNAPRSAQVLIVSAQGGATNVVLDQANRFPAVPVAVARDYVATYRFPGTYETLPRPTGALRAETAGSFRSVSWDRGVAVLGVIQEFESQPRSLRVWDVRDFSRQLAAFDGTFGEARFWSGRSEVLFSVATELRAIDYSTGRTRSVGAIPAGARLVAMDSSGGHLLIATGPSSFRLLEYAGGQFVDRGVPLINLPSNVKPLLLR